jgi:hypothetical protein
MEVKGITKDDVLMGLMPYTTMIFTREIRIEILILDIDDNIFIPYII